MNMLMFITKCQHKKKTKHVLFVHMPDEDPPVAVWITTVGNKGRNGGTLLRKPLRGEVGMEERFIYFISFFGSCSKPIVLKKKKHNFFYIIYLNLFRLIRPMIVQL